MRPPAIRRSTGPSNQHRPHFGAPPGPTPCSHKTTMRASTLNTDSLFTQNCQRSHELNAIPLLEANRFRGKREAGFGHEAPRPKLPTRPNVQAPILVKTWM